MAGKSSQQIPREQFGEGSTGSLLRSIHAWRAEQERELITLRTQGGKNPARNPASLFPLGSHSMGTCGLILTRSTARRGTTSDPETAPIVQRIFTDALRGIPMRRIATNLTKRGYTLSL